MWIVAGIKHCKSLPISNLCTTTHYQSEGLQKGEVTNYNVQQYQEKPLMFYRNCKLGNLRSLLKMIGKQFCDLQKPNFVLASKYCLQHVIAIYLLLVCRVLQIMNFTCQRKLKGVYIECVYNLLHTFVQLWIKHVANQIRYY